jgi:hypothetical protein
MAGRHPLGDKPEHHDFGHRLSACGNEIDEVEAVQGTGHVDVGDNGIDARCLGEDSDRFQRVRRFKHLIAFVLQRFYQTRRMRGSSSATKTVCWRGPIDFSDID